jgi:hypothetical protein
MAEDQASLRKLLDGLQATGVSEQVRAAIERTYGAVTASQADAAEELPAGAGVQILEYSFYRGRLHVVGDLVFPGVVDRILLGAPPWTRITDLPLTHVTDTVVHFDGEVELDGGSVDAGALLVRTLDHRIYRAGNLAARGLATSPTGLLYLRFQALVAEMAAPKVLEIGARARTGLNRQWLPAHAEYVGFDIVKDANVDVVGDAHRMSDVLPARYFDAAFSLATFEHLAMPWIAAVELNKVMRTGGYVMHLAPQAWPVHEAPWDFFRFSEYAWASLFNKYSGFEIIEAVSSDPAIMFPVIGHQMFIGMPAFPGYLGSAVLARKIGESELRWDVDVDEVLTSSYPD